MAITVFVLHRRSVTILVSKKKLIKLFGKDFLLSLPNLGIFVRGMYVVSKSRRPLATFNDIKSYCK